MGPDRARATQSHLHSHCSPDRKGNQNVGKPLFCQHGRRRCVELSPPGQHLKAAPGERLQPRYPAAHLSIWVDEKHRSRCLGRQRF